MPPINHDLDQYVGVDLTEDAPMSRTHQYRKVMKPLLERKRRARINKCLDDLKDLMVHALQSEGESITKLEKADVLELTVRHLQKLKRQQQLQVNPGLDIDRYQAGFSACANEVSRFMATVPGVNVNFGTGLMSHLGNQVRDENSLSVNTTTQPQQQQQRPHLPISPVSDGGYTSGRDSSSPALSVGSPSPVPRPEAVTSSVWRPF
jgi:hairy-and-enhancer-of-split protein